MLPRVESALNAVLGAAVTLQHANGPGRAFELYVMTGVAIRLPPRGFDVWLQRSDGTRVSPTDPDRRFIQRGGKPTGISPAASGPGNASAIGLRHKSSGAAWEIWNGVQFRGRSSAPHEIDLALVPEQTGAQLRLTGGMALGRPWVSVECKDVGTAGSLDEMRAFVARMYDLTVLHGHRRYLPTGQVICSGPAIYPAPVTYRDANQAAFSAIVRRTRFARGSAAMTAYYSVRPYAQVVVNAPEATQFLDEVADWIAIHCH